MVGEWNLWEDMQLLGSQLVCFSGMTGLIWGLAECATPVTSCVSFRIFIYSDPVINSHLDQSTDWVLLILAIKIFSSFK